MDLYNVSFSIIIPAYNAEKHIRRAIVSLQRQTFDNWEAIIVDDGSSDDSFKVCQQLSIEDNRIKVAHQENSGPNAARNAGLDMAQGKYISFLDADDELRSKTLKEVFACFEQSETLDVVVIPQINEENDKLSTWRGYPNTDILLSDKKEILTSHFQIDSLFPGGLHGKFYKNHIFKGENALRLNEKIRFGEDRIMMHEIIERTNGSWLLSHCGGYIYHTVEGSACNSCFTLSKALDMARNQVILNRVVNKYNINNPYFWNGAVKCCIDAWSLGGHNSELKAYMIELASDKSRMASNDECHRMVKLAKKTSPLFAARFKWLMVRILHKNKI